MINQTSPALGSPLPLAISSTRAAFAMLDRATQRLLASILFDGEDCAQIARSSGSSVLDVRRRVGAAMRELHAAVTVRDGERGGVVEAMLALRALDALDPDEAELVDAMLAHQPALQRSYDEDRALIAALCTMVPRVAPSPCVLARLRTSIGDDTAN